MSLNFPANPTDGQTFTFGGVEYTYSAALDRWFVVGASGGGGAGLEVEDLVTGDLTVAGALEAAEASIKQLFFLDATGGTLELSQQLQVGDLEVGDDARPVKGAGLLAVGADGQYGGEIDPANPVGTTTGDFAVGDQLQYLSWDQSEGELSIQGRITQVTADLIEGGSLPADTQQFTTAGTHDLALFGAGVYVAILWGGGGGGGANSNSDNAGSAHGGGAGGMAIVAFDYDGTSTLTANVGNGGTGTTANGRSAFNFGNNGNATNLVLGGTTIATANGGGRGTNNGGTGGTGVVNIASNNALFAAANTNSAKGTAGNGACSGGAGVVIPTIETADANLTAASGGGNYVSGGGSMIYNQAGGNGFTNNTTTYTPNLVSGFATLPNIAGGDPGAPGAGSGGGNPNIGGAGGRFSGGGGAQNSFGDGSTASGGAGGFGSGGGAAASGRVDEGGGSTSSGAGGAAGVIISRL